MSGGFWAGSVPPWASVILVLVCGLVFVLGLAAGESMGRRHELEERAEEEGERAARQFRRMRQPELRERKTSTAAFLDPTPYGAVMFAAAAPELAHEWEPAHVGQALAIANGDPISTGEIRAITERIDEWLPRLLAAHPVPYPTEEQ